jgi:hypothetical protein
MAKGREGGGGGGEKRVAAPEGLRIGWRRSIPPTELIVAAVLPSAIPICGLVPLWVGRVSTREERRRSVCLVVSFELEQDGN